MSPRIPRMTRGQVAAVLHRPAELGPMSPLLGVRRRKNKKNAQPEHEMQCAFFEWLDSECEAQYPGISLDAFAVPNGVRVGIRQAGKLKREGLRAGVPDICIDRACGGYFGLRLEMKVKGGRVSDEQEKRMMRLTAMGYCARVAWSLDEAKEYTLQYLAFPPTEVTR